MRVSPLLAIVGGAFAGFVVGFGIGQETRKATPSRVGASVDGGTVTITADVQGAVTDGVQNWLTSL